MGSDTKSGKNPSGSGSASFSVSKVLAPVDFSVPLFAFRGASYRWHVTSNLFFWVLICLFSMVDYDLHQGGFGGIEINRNAKAMAIAIPFWWIFQLLVAMVKHEAAKAVGVDPSVPGARPTPASITLHPFGPLGHQGRSASFGKDAVVAFSSVVAWGFLFLFFVLVRLGENGSVRYAAGPFRPLMDLNSSLGWAFVDALVLVCGNSFLAAALLPAWPFDGLRFVDDFVGALGGSLVDRCIVLGIWGFVVSFLVLLWGSGVFEEPWAPVIT